MYACSFACLCFSLVLNIMSQSQPDGPESSSNCSPFDGLVALAGQLPIGRSYNIYHSNYMLTCLVSLLLLHIKVLHNHHYYHSFVCEMISY